MTEPAEFRFDSKVEFPHLAAAPIVEGVLHWNARPTTPFVAAELRKQLESRLKAEYPKVEDVNLFQLEAQLGADGTSAQHHNRWQGFRLVSGDGRRIVQFHRDALVFSHLQPYTNWSEFTAEGKRLWALFCELGAVTEVQRFAVRFINRVSLDNPSDVGAVLKNPPKCLEGLGLPSNRFLYSSRHDVPHHPLQVEVIQAIQPPAPPRHSNFGLILDIDVFTTQGFGCNNDVLDDYLAKMRYLKNAAFFHLVTPESIRKFEKV